MKTNTIAIIVVLISLFSCNNSTYNNSKANNIDEINQNVTESLPIIQFEKETHNFGIIQQGEKVSYSFKFKNIGKGNLIITDASASCGCTAPRFSREPIASGKSGEIEVIFDSNNRSGQQFKSVTVWTNCEPNKAKLYITSEIILP